MLSAYDKLNAELAKRTFLTSLRLELDEGVANLNLELADAPNSLNGVRVTFENAADLKCNLPLGGWSQLHMLGIRSSRDGGRRLVVEEIEYNSLRLTCSDAKIT